MNTDPHMEQEFTPPHGTSSKVVRDVNEQQSEHARKLVLDASKMTSPEQLDSRIDLLEEAARLGNLEAHFELGWICEAKRRFDKARKHFEISSAGGLPAPFAALAHVAEVQGDLISAETNYAEAVGGGLDARLELARVMAALGKTVPARNILEVLAKENRPEALNELGMLLHREGDFKQSERRWKQAAKLGNLDAKANLGRIVIESGFKKRRYRRYLKSAVDARHPGSVNMLGYYSAENGLLEDAQRCWEISAAGGDENAHRNLGKLARERGDEQLALEWERAADNPNADETRRLLETHGLLGSTIDEAANQEALPLPDPRPPGTTPVWIGVIAFLVVVNLLRTFL